MQTKRQLRSTSMIMRSWDQRVVAQTLEWHAKRSPAQIGGRLGEGRPNTLSVADERSMI